MTEPIQVEHSQDGVSTLRLNRPPLNLLDHALLSGLSDALQLVDTRNETRSVVITAAGERAFSGGHDLKESPAVAKALDPHLQPGGTGRFVTEQIESLAKPVVFAGRGWIVGGAISLMLASDIRIVSETACLRYVEVQRGFAPAWGLVLGRLVHYIGRTRTLDFLLGAGDVDARRAFELGLVTKVVPDDELEQHAYAVATALAEREPLTTQCIKESVLMQYTQPYIDVQQAEEEWLRRIANQRLNG